MKNKAEREAFLRDYHKWDILWHFQPLNLSFYFYRFKNGAKVILTVANGAKYKDVRYNLIIPPDDNYGDNYNPFDRAPNEFKAYNLHGVGIGTIVDYMTKRRDVI